MSVHVHDYHLFNRSFVSHRPDTRNVMMNKNRYGPAFVLGKNVKGRVSEWSLTNVRMRED